MKYNFDEPVNRLNTNCYKWDLLGEEYLPLWVADMDFAVPQEVTDRLQKRLNHGVYGYFLTGNEVYDAIGEWFSKEYGVTEVTKDWVKIIPGIVPGLCVASNIGGGKSITNTPNYVNLIKAPGYAGNEMITVPLTNEDEYYTIDFDALQAAVTEDTKVFYLCNPQNPVGRVYTYEELKQVSEFCKKNNLLVVSDEAHCEIVFEGKHIPFFTVDDYARNHSITFYSNGKMFNLPDLILAFAVIPNKELKDEFERLGYAFGEEHILNVEAGIATYRDAREWKAAMVDYLKANRDYMENELTRRFPKAKFTHLQATYLMWVDFRAYGDEVDAKFFREKAKVFLTDGEEFGQKGYVRINLGTQKAIIGQALDRMEEALKEVL